ncbi:MAG TPA: hypothetical protein VFG47_11070 [Geminicoccaceae bacterium]|nr:hypothetical protein [Geminicoccaceae bacterium]
MIATAITAGLVLALGLLLPVLLWWVLRAAGREERVMAEEIARAQARAMGRGARAAVGPPPDEGSRDGTRPRARDAA